MILSMTGFGRASASSASKKITVEVKSLNSKQLDLSMRMPSYFREKEIRHREDVTKALSRGKVEVTVSVENLVAATPSTFNQTAVEAYKHQIEAVSEKCGLPLPTDWYSVLLHLPDVLVAEQKTADDDDATALAKALREALDELVEFRRQEGAKLEVFFRKKISNIRTLLDTVDPYEAERIVNVRRRLEDSLAKLSADHDKDRFEQELIFYIEKLDVTEEKTRLRAHLNYFLETLDLPSGGQGKKIGFIAQEMGREINTLGSKANHAELQKIVVKMKDELEQIKEQVLNVL